jgi:hypothetical protein
MAFEAPGIDQATLKRLTKQAQQILVQDEQILGMAVQLRRFVGLRPDAAVVTNRRIIIFRPGLFSLKFEDGLWRDMDDVALEESALSARLIFRFSDGRVVTVDRLTKESARRAYSIAEGKEEESLEVRRQRKMEEDRAKAGGVIVGGSAATLAPGMPAAGGTMAKLTQLKALFDAQLITEEEYKKRKEQVLSEL